jgi:hypothetical protein
MILLVLDSSNEGLAVPVGAADDDAAAIVVEDNNELLSRIGDADSTAASPVACGGFRCLISADSMIKRNKELLPQRSR